MDLAVRIREILAAHGLVTSDLLDDTVRRIILAIYEDRRTGGW